MVSLGIQNFFDNFNTPFYFLLDSNNTFSFQVKATNGDTFLGAEDLIMHCLNFWCASSRELRELI